jgi:hypothetical protein
MNASSEAPQLNQDEGNENNEAMDESIWKPALAKAI